MTQVLRSERDIEESLFPFSLIRHVADIRIGILTIRQKWELILGRKIDAQKSTDAVLNKHAVIPANIIPSSKLISQDLAGGGSVEDYSSDQVKRLTYPWDISRLNDWAIREDFELLTAGRRSVPIPSSVIAINPSHIFVEPGATLSHCILNASTGPIYVGVDSTIMEGATIRGPFALCKGAVVKMGARIYGATTIGPYSVAGGEIKNSLFIGYSNKAHEGYLGDSVIGEWCNLGAGTTNSNLKNNAGTIKVWNPYRGKFVEVGSKCGLLLGDYSQAAINTSFNTGTITGICANIFMDGGLTPKYIPSFSWGLEASSRYDFDKAIHSISNWKKLKDKTLTEVEIRTLKHIFDQL